MKKFRLIAIASIINFLFFFVLYSYLIKNDFGDFPSHLYMIYQMSQDRLPLPGNFLIYLIASSVKVFAFQKLITIFLLAAATTLKFVISYFFIKYFLKFITDKKAILVSITLLFLFALPNLNLVYKEYYYLGSFTPNVWHNTTIMVLMPFTLLLYFTIFIKPQNTVLNIILIFLNIIIKPSFIFIMVPLLIIKQLFTFENSKIKINFNFNKTYCIYILFSLLFLAIQYYTIYVISPDSKSGVQIVFFDSFEKPWQYFNILIGLCASFLFPIATLLLLRKADIHTFNTIILLAVALLINFSIIETGDRRGHGNFSWQIIPASYLLFLFTTISVLKYKHILTKWKLQVLTSCFLTHLNIRNILHYENINNKLIFLKILKKH